MIPYGHQDISQDDIDAVVRVLRSDFLTQGPAVPAFEQAVAKRVNARQAVAVNSATSALHVACLALGLGPGDRLWTVPNTFVASANCALYCGAAVDFVDIDPVTRNMSVPDLERRLARAQAEERLPKVVVPVHFAGLPTQQEAIWNLAQRFRFRVIEDASHSIGASVGDEPVGSCRWSDITVFSFHPVKIITSAEGGMAMTNDESLMRGMAMARSHGISRDPGLFEDGGDDPPPWHYEQHMLGFNYRMTDLHAALGLSQLARLDGFVERRNLLAQRYADAFEGTVLQLPASTAGVRSAFHLYVIRLGPGASAGDRRQMFDHLRKRGVGVNVHYIPVHLHPHYRRLGFSEGSFPQAEAHAREAITLPLYPAMTEQQQDEVIGAVLEFLGMKVAIIPARGGSKRIPRKNIRVFAGLPMIAHSIQCARASGVFERIVVSTDDPEIAEISRRFGAETPFMRPPALSDDHTGTTEVVAHAVRELQTAGAAVSAACCIYATAPFVSPDDIREALRVLQAGDWNYVFSATRFSYPIFRSFRMQGDGGLNMFFPEHFGTRSQDLPEAMHDAGQFYWGRPDAWLGGARIFDARSTVVDIPAWRVQDIDNLDDWTRAEHIMSLIRRTAPSC